MVLDLVTERNIQLFMQLAQLLACPVSENMYWRQPRRDIFLTSRSGGMQISQRFPLVDQDSANHLLEQGLSRWQPTRFGGIAQQLYRLRDGMIISCHLPLDSSAEVWLMLYKRQWTFLEALCFPG